MARSAPFQSDRCIVTVKRETITERLVGGALTVTLNRPAKLNAMNDVMRVEFLDALRRAAESDDVRAVVIRGAGGNFCAGGDVSDMGTGSGGTAARVGRGIRIIEALAHHPKPVISAVEGYAVGAGFSLVLCSDIVVATPAARFQMAFVGRGLAPDMAAAYYLPRQVGLLRAKEIALTARVVEADEASRLGIVARLWNANEFEGRLRTLAAEIATGPTLAFGATRRLMERSTESGLAAALDMEAFIQPALGNSRDHVEAVAAFAEKRTAKFEGC